MTSQTGKRCLLTHTVALKMKKNHIISKVLSINHAHPKFPSKIYLRFVCDKDRKEYEKISKSDTDFEKKNANFFQRILAEEHFSFFVWFRAGSLEQCKFFTLESCLAVLCFSTNAVRSKQILTVTRFTNFQYSQICLIYASLQYDNFVFLMFDC